MACILKQNMPKGYEWKICVLSLQKQIDDFAERGDFERFYRVGFFRGAAADYGFGEAEAGRFFYSQRGARAGADFSGEADFADEADVGGEFDVCGGGG